MPIEIPAGDLARTTSHEPDHSWPSEVKVQLVWYISGRPHVRTAHIDADHFFGRGAYHAPLDGSALVQQIENLRRAGPPPVERKRRGR